MSLFHRMGSWFKQITGRKQTPYRRNDARLRKLLVEVLEDRLAPAIPGATHIFELNGTFADSVNPAIVMTGPGGTLDATGYTFGIEQGPSTDVLVTQHYALEMRFTVDPSAMADLNDKKLVDFGNRTSDTGVYFRNRFDNLMFYKQGVFGAFASSANGSFPQSGPIHFVLNRDAASKTVSTYVNGVFQFSFVDAASDAVFHAKMHYLIDNTDENPAGVLDYVRTYARPLTTDEIDYLYLGGLPGVTEGIPPTVLSATSLGATSLQVTFSEPVLGAAVTSNYELRNAGPDLILGNGDDVAVTLSTASYAGNTATLTFPPLTAGFYLLTVKDTITDTAGNPLDGDADGTPFGDWMHAFASGAQPPAATHLFDLNGSFADLVIPSIVMTGPGGTLGATGYTFAMGQGPNTDVIVTPQNYALEMKFSLDSFGLPGHPGDKILDFKNRTTDTGLYSDIGNRRLLFYHVASTASPAGVVAVGPNDGFPVSGPVHLVVNRDGATNLFTAYVNGVFQFSFVDTIGETIFQTKMNYLIDDNPAANENPPGTLDYLRTYPQPLTPAEVIYLHQGGEPAHRIVVTSTADAGPGTIRQAILDANQFTGPDLIEFEIAGVGPHTISLSSALPEITEAVTIDGWSQPGFVDTPLIELNGSGLPGVDGLRVFAPNVQLRGLVVSNFGGAGLFIDGTGDVIASAITIGSLAGAGSIQIDGGTLTTGGDNTTTTFSGAITGTGALTKVGAGTFTLSGVTSFSGATTIEAGTLALERAASNNNLASSPTINILSGAFLDVRGLDNSAVTDTLALASGQTLKGNGTVLGSTLAASGGNIAPGASAGILNVGSVSFASGSAFNVEIGGLIAGTDYDQLQVTGTVTLNGANLNLTFGYTPALGDSFTLIDNDGGINPVDPVLGTGTFKIGGVTIPEGGMFYLSGKLFSLTYAGGQGANDVVLTRVLGNFVRGTYSNDLNANGKRDAGEPGLVGSTIYVDVNNNAQVDVGEPSTTTQANDPATAADEAGRYEFQLPTGTYTIRRVPQSNVAASFPSLVASLPPNSFVESRHVVNVSSTNVTGADFGDFTNRAVTFTTLAREVNETDGIITITGNLGNLDAPFGRDMSIPVTITGLTATEGKDYDRVDAFMTFLANSTQGTLRLKVRTDNRFETLRETLNVRFQAATGFTIADPTNPFVLTIKDVDTAPLVTLVPTSTSEKAVEGTEVMVTVTLSGDSDLPITVPLQILSSSTVVSTDYTVIGGSTTLTVTSGRTASFRVRINNDANVEAGEFLRIGFDPVLSHFVNTAPASASSVRVINIPDERPEIIFSSSALTQGEGDTAAVNAVVSIANNPTQAAINVPFTIKGSAVSTDRTIATVINGVTTNLAAGATSGTLNIPGNVTSATIRITIINDVTDETQEETVELVLGTPSVGVVPRNGTFILSITDDDVPQLSFKSMSTTSFWEDEASKTFTVVSSIASTSPIIVPIVLSGDNTKTAGNTTLGYARSGTTGDFTISASVTIPAGLKEGTGTITINNDTDNTEAFFETFTMSLGTAPAGTKLGAATATTQTITIKDNDPIVTVSVLSTTHAESGTATFNVGLNHVTHGDIYVRFALNGTVGSSDITFPTASWISTFEGSRYLYFPEGTYTRAVDVPITADTTDEANETLGLTVYNSIYSNYKVGSPSSAKITINDNDGIPTVSYGGSDFPINETNKDLQGIGLTLSNAAAYEIFVKPSFVADGGAVRGADYLAYLPFDPTNIYAAQGYVRFAPGQTQVTFFVQMVNRSGPQGNRSFTMKIDSVLYAKSGGNSVFVLIVDNNNAGTASATTQQTISQQKQQATASGVLPFTPDPQTGATVDPALAAAILESSNFTTGKISVATIGTVELEGVGSMGLLEGATAFFDANFNGVADFLDINGDGIQDEDEPDEPAVETGKDGSFGLILPPVFDRDDSGFIEASEGRWVLAGGFDTSTGLTWTTRLYAPVSEFVITPVTSLVEELVRTQGMTVADAESRVIEALMLPSADLSSINPLAGLRRGDETSGRFFAAHITIYNTVAQIAGLFAGKAGDLPLDYFADLVYAELAGKISAAGTNADLANAALIADLINGVSSRTGVEFSEDDRAGAATVIASGNGAVAAVPRTYDQDYATAVVKVKKVFQGDAATALHAVGAGTQAIADVVESFTQPNLQARIDSAVIGNIFPSVIGINDAQIKEGDAGAKILEFQVFMVGEHTDTVTVDYATEDIAAVAGDDYVTSTGTLTWLAGDTSPKTIQVTINGDTDFEQDEMLRVLLSNGQNVVVRKPVGFGFILNDDAAQFSTDTEPVDGANTFVITHSDLRAAFDQNGASISDGTFFDPLDLTVDGQDNIDDRLVLDFSANTFRSDVISYHGGAGASIDSVEIRGGVFASITQKLTNATDGQTIFHPGEAEDDGEVTLNWFGLEPFLIAVGGIGDMIFELPAGISDAILEDADPSDDINPGMMQLRSATGAFETTIFANPTRSLTIRGSNGVGSVVIASTDPAFVGVVLTLGTLTSPREAGSSITANGLATLFATGTLTKSWSVFKDDGLAASFTGGDLSSFAFMPTAVGSYRIVFTADDGAGTVVQDETSVLVVDTTAPNFTAPADIAIEAASTAGTVVNYTLPTATDIVDGSVAVTADTGHAPGSTFPLGATIVTLTSTDAAGNSASHTFRIFVGDTTAPVTTFQSNGPAGGNGWFRGTVAISLLATDAGSGVATTQYRTSQADRWITGTSFAISSAGIHTVRYRSIDVAGNIEAVQSMTVKIDKTKPLTTASLKVGEAKYLPGTATTRPVTVTLTAKDTGGSGVALTKYSLDGGTTWNTYAGPFNVSVTGVYRLTYYSQDVAGNTEAASVVKIIKITGVRKLALAQPKLAVTVAPGSTYDFVIKYANKGTQVSPNAYITVALPRDGTFDPARNPAGWVDMGGGVYRINLGDLPGGTGGSVRFTVTFAGNVASTRKTIFTAKISDGLGVNLATSSVAVTISKMGWMF